MTVRIPRGWYKTFGYACAGVFAAVGLLFLVIPRGVVAFFNGLIPGMRPAPNGTPGFYDALALGFMAVVTALAGSMARRPDERAYARMLGVAKIASAAFSLGFALARVPALIFFVNAVVDGSIGVLVLVLRPAPVAEPVPEGGPAG